MVLADGFTSVVAQRKTGKTTFNLNLADSFLTGRDFLGRFPVVPVTGNSTTWPLATAISR